jgi:hypothetical protein
VEKCGYCDWGETGEIAEHSVLDGSSLSDHFETSTLLPSLVRYRQNAGTAKQALRERLQQISLNTLEKETGLSRHMILRARRGERVHPRSLQSPDRGWVYSRSQTVTKPLNECNRDLTSIDMPLLPS